MLFDDTHRSYVIGSYYNACNVYDCFFSPIGQEYPFLQVSEIFLSQPVVSA